MHTLYHIFLKLILCTGLLAGSIIPALSTEATLETSMEEFVKQVIRDNPELIIESLNEYIKEQKALKKKGVQLGDRFINRLDDQVGPDNPSRGPVDAPITIITYSEFQCPYCKKAAKTISQVMDAYPDQIRVIFKNLPLQFHDDAIPAAYSALAAMRQGKFWEYHDVLFTDGTPLNEESYRKIANTLELDLEQFDSDRQSEEIAEQVREDMERAKTLNLNATPSFIINGVLVQGARPLEYFSKIIDRLLQEENRTVKSPS